MGPVDTGYCAADVRVKLGNGYFPHGRDANSLPSMSRHLSRSARVQLLQRGPTRHVMLVICRACFETERMPVN